MGVIYIKYNRERAKPFQTVTKIIEKEGVKTAVKEALCLEGVQHIQQMMQSYERLKEKYPHIHFAYPTNLTDQSIAFEMVPGKSLEFLMYQAILSHNLEEVERYFKLYMDFIESISTHVEKFESSDEFEKIFGVFKIDSSCKVMEKANIDLIFSNIYITNDQKIYVIDYEWSYDFPVPVEYIISRALINMNFTSHGDFKQLFDYSQYVDDESYQYLERNFKKYIEPNRKKEVTVPTVKKSEKLFDNFDLVPRDSKIQLFPYIGGEIVVEKMKSYVIEKSDNFFQFFLSEWSDLTHIRIDITNFSAEVEIESIEIKDENDNYFDLSLEWSNANEIIGNCFSYFHNDPVNVYTLKNLELKMWKTLDIKFSYRPLRYLEIVGKNSEELREKKSELKEKNKEIQEKNEELYRIYSSKKWILFTWVGNFKNKFKNYFQKIYKKTP